MLISRVIPCLLLRDGALVKTIRFKKPQYIGDPLNAVRIFNEYEVDELLFLDISASIDLREPPFDFLKTIAGECFMPLGYGGGLRTTDHLKRLFAIGVEKAVINTAAFEDLSFISKAAELFGSQCVVVSIDAKKNMWGKYRATYKSGTKVSSYSPLDWAKQVENYGAGEILINSVDRDGVMGGYDLELVRQIASAVKVPVVACGGAGSVADLGTAVNEGGAAAAAAGSIFVYQKRNRSVLINFPSAKELEQLFPR